MKITKMQLKRIIREEQEKLIRHSLVKESRSEAAINSHRGETDFGGSMLDLDDYEEFEDMILSAAKSWAKMTGYTEEDVIQALKSIVEEI
jgi:hypothetical protein